MSKLEGPSEQSRTDFNSTATFVAAPRTSSKDVHLGVSTEISFLGSSTDVTSEKSARESLASRLSSPVQQHTSDSRKLPRLRDSFEQEFWALNLKEEEEEVTSGAENFTQQDSFAELEERARPDDLSEWLTLFHSRSRGLLHSDEMSAPVSWDPPEIAPQARLHSRGQTSWADRTSESRDDVSLNFPKRKKPRPKNDKKKEKDKERLRLRIIKRVEEAAHTLVPEQALCSVDLPQSDCTRHLHASSHSRQSSEHYLGRLPDWLQDSTPTAGGATSDTRDVINAEFECVEKEIGLGLLRRETWPYPYELTERIEYHGELATQHGTLLYSPTSFYRAAMEREEATIAKRRTEPHEKLTWAYHEMHMIPEDAMVGPETE